MAGEIYCNTTCCDTVDPKEAMQRTVGKRKRKGLSLEGMERKTVREMTLKIKKAEIQALIQVIFKPVKL